MTTNIHFNSFSKGQFNKNYAPIANLIGRAFINQGFTVTKEPGLLWWQELDGVTEQIGGDEGCYNIYCETNIDPIIESPMDLFFGVSAPLPGYFTLDKIGSVPYIEPTYTKPDLDKIDVKNYPTELVNDIIANKQNHFHSKTLNPGLDSPSIDVPEDHLLILVNESETDWRNGWQRLQTIINRLLVTEKMPIVIKYDPRFTLNPDGTYSDTKIKEHEMMFNTLSVHDNITVFTGQESIHDIMPKSKVVLVDESSQNLEMFYYDKPTITHGFPHYRWACKQILHQHELIPAIKDTSWYNRDLMRRWFTWYMTEYVCYDQESTDRRVKQLLNII